MTNTRSGFSIVTTSYNQGPFLEQAMRSVLDQDYPRVEYIIIDGGSTDNSLEIIKKYEARLAFWCSEPDGGPAAALNKGFRHATGDILGFLNADDFYLPGCFRRVVAEFERAQMADVIYGNGFFTNRSGELGKRILSDDWDLRRVAYGSCVIMQQATFLGRMAFEKIAGFNENNRTCWDGELWVDLALGGATFRKIEDFLAVFRIHQDSISGSGRLEQEYSRDRERIFQRIMGRRPSVRDRLYEYVYRCLKAGKRLAGCSGAFSRMGGRRE